MPLPLPLLSSSSLLPCRHHLRLLDPSPLLLLPPPPCPTILSCYHHGMSRRGRRLVLAGATSERSGNAAEELATPKLEIESDLVTSTSSSSYPSRSRSSSYSSASKRKAERNTYLFAAVASTVGITTLAAASVYYRFVWQMQGSGEVPVLEMFGTFSLAVGAAVGMEFWARWAHRALWHASLWDMHESHHRPREGPFELNDVFAIINAVPAIALLSYGFFHKGLIPGLCFGAGLGITVFGMAYMFVHDGLVHRRFPVGPVADVPYLQKVAAAHQLHHADLFQGVPYGLFLGPKELEEVGGSQELERIMNLNLRGKKAQTTSTTTSRSSSSV